MKDLGGGWTQQPGGECQHPDWEIVRYVSWGGAVWRNRKTGEEVGTGNPRGCHPAGKPAAGPAGGER